MDGVNLPHKKRRHDGNYSSKYHSTTNNKGTYRDDGKNWQSDIYHGENRGVSNRKKDKNWDIQLNLIGRKVKDPMIHICDICNRPILSYGRMIPCKHVFCFSCAKQTDKNCPRCKEDMQRIEQCPLGSVWLCSVNIACRRTYLSQRDLQAHINHRHSKPVSAPMMPPLVLPPVSTLGSLPPITVPPPPLLQPPLNRPFLTVPPPQPVSAANQHLTPPANVDSAPRPSSNLITIPIQDNDSQSYPPPPPPGRPANQPQLFPSSGQVEHRHYQQMN